MVTMLFDKTVALCYDRKDISAIYYEYGSFSLFFVIAFHLLIFCLSPTLFIIRIVKQSGLPCSKKQIIFTWRALMLILLVLAFFHVVSFEYIKIEGLVPLILWFVASRIIEILFAFYNDIKSRMKGENALSDIDPHDRLTLAILSYLEIIVLFSVLYYSGETMIFSNSDTACSDPSLLPFWKRLVNVLYFSCMTITTVGYGDITVNTILMRLAAMLETLIGLFLAVCTIGLYLSLKKEE